MYRNKLDMGATIPVIIDGDTYYACCPGCADKLKLNYQDSQFGVDEYSHHKVKKSQAFIVLSDKSNGKVKYFESKKNFDLLEIQK
jgi:hypothetical protein